MKYLKSVVVDDNDVRITVAELVKYLQEQPQDAEVWWQDADTGKVLPLITVESAGMMFGIQPAPQIHGSAPNEMEAAWPRESGKQVFLT